MQRFATVARAAWLLSVAAGAADPHPIEGVIQLLKGLATQVKEEGKTEALTYAKFEKWCADSTKELKKAISSEKLTIDSLTSKVDGKTKEEATLTEQISALADEITKHQAAALAADDDRTQANDLYTAADKDAGDTIDAIQEAIDALKEAGTATGAALIQTRLVQLTKLPLLLAQLSDAQRQALLSAGVEAPEGILAAGNAAAAEKKYSFKSGNVVELLKELKAKFEDDRLEATKAETNAQNAHALTKAARANALEAAEAAKLEKTGLLAEVQSEIATAQTSLAATQDDLQADSTSLDDTERSCSMKKGEWDERSKIREKELKAMAAGVEILAKVSGVRTEAPTNAAAPESPLSLLVAVPGKVKSVAAPVVVSKTDTAVATTQSPAASLHLKAADPKGRAVNLLRSEARRVHSRSFERFADQVAARLTGPFDEVNGMIQKMIFQLMKEQTDEDEHKNWCDLELEKTNSSLANKVEKAAMLNAKLADAKASEALAATKIEEDQEMVRTITAFIQEATAVRQAGKAENAEAIKDARAAQAAIAQATAVLESFYKDSGMVAKESWELLQLRRGVTLPEEPSTWSASYTGVSDPNDQPNGIISVLKGISANFATMEADTAAQEITDQKEFVETIKANEIEKARRAKEAEVKGEEKKRLLDKIDEMNKSLKNVNNELGAVEQYLKDLSPACVEGDSTYEERKANRVAEIDALKEAQVLLRDAFKEDAEPSASFLSPIRRVQKV